MNISGFIKISVLMKIGVVASILLVATLSQARHCCDFKIDALNRQALSLKEHCVSIKEFVDCISTDCCGGGGESCPCAPEAITVLEKEITHSGSYCLNNDVTSITVSADVSVVIDLNSYTAGTVTLRDNSVVKNGTANQITVGVNNAVSNVKVSSVVGDGAGSSAVLIDCRGLSSLQNVERVVMARCTGDGVSYLYLRAGVKDVTMYDSLLASIIVPVDSFDLTHLALYQSIIKSSISFAAGDSLQEIELYQSVIGNEIQFNTVVVPQFKRMMIEESQVGRVAMYLIDDPQTVNASIQRSVFTEGITLQRGNGLLVRKCQFGGGLGLYYDSNVKVDNVSITALGAAVSMSGGKNILLTDCCATAPVSGQTGYNTSAPNPENLNLLHCYASDCYNGFNIASDSCLIKDCVCVGAANTSFIGGDNVCAVGNIALSVGGVPAANYNPTTAPFNIDADTTFIVPSVNGAANTLERSAWRNMSFELP